MRIDLDEPTHAVVVSASRAASNAYAEAYSTASSSRTMGFGGEAAASIYVTGSSEPFFRKCEAINLGNETPDLLDFPGIEVKTVPNISNAHFAVGDGYSREVKVADYIVFRCLSTKTYQAEGWLPSNEIEYLWNHCGQMRFPSGSPMLNCSTLRPEQYCPWRSHAIR